MIKTFVCQTSRFLAGKHRRVAEISATRLCQWQWRWRGDKIRRGAGLAEGEGGGAGRRAEAKEGAGTALSEEGQTQQKLNEVAGLAEAKRINRACSS